MKSLLIIGLLLPLMGQAMEPDIHIEIPPSPVIRPIPRNDAIVNFAAIDLDGDGIIDAREEEICRMAIRTYFQEQQIIINDRRIVPFLQEQIRRSSDSPHPEERRAVNLLRRLATKNLQARSSHEEIQHDEHAVQKLLINAAAQALIALEKEAEHNKEEAENRISKKNSNVRIIIGSALSMIGSAVATFLLTYTQGCQ